MAIFALITDLEIINPPEWYEDFTNRYLSRPKPHITLIQPRHMHRDEGVALMHTLADALSNYAAWFPMEATAHGIKPFDDGTGFLIGIAHDRIDRIQHELRSRMPSHLEFYNPASKAYEQNFWSHLTMADQIPKGELAQIFEQFNLENLRLEVRVHKILCTLPPDFSLEESLKEENYHVMSLKATNTHKDSPACC